MRFSNSVMWRKGGYGVDGGMTHWEDNIYTRLKMEKRLQNAQRYCRVAPITKNVVVVDGGDVVEVANRCRVC